MYKFYTTCSSSLIISSNILILAHQQREQPLPGSSHSLRFDMRQSLFLGITALLTSGVFAGDKDWLSPEYKQIFQNPLPFPPVKAPKYTYTNKTTGNQIDYYEIDVKPFEQQVYPGLKPARLVG